MNLPAEIVLPAICLVLAGCTSEQLYNTAEQSGRSQCDRIKALPERQRCLNERGVPYDTYKRERDKAASQP